MYHFFSSLLQPYTILLLLALFAVGRLWRRRTETRRRLLLATVPLALLTICSLPVVGYWALASLEWQYESVDRVPDGVETIVVLSGYAFPPDPSRPEPLLGIDSQLRCLQALRLYREKRCLIVVSGGRVNADDPGPALGELMKAFLLDYGVAEEDIAVEGQSSNTYENARDTAELLTPLGMRQIVLVTTASHLPRAVACFEAQGLTVTPSGCDQQAGRFPGSATAWIPSTAGLSAVHAAFHEWAGMCLYYVKGDILLFGATK